MTDRPTDHATLSVTICRIYVRSTVMRPKNNNNSKTLTRGRTDNFSNILADRDLSAGGYLGLFTVSNLGQHRQSQQFLNPCLQPVTVDFDP